jgi:calcineurin-like phosphoesterase
MRTHMPRRFTVADGEVCAQGVIFDINPVTGRANAVSRVEF